MAAVDRFFGGMRRGVWGGVTSAVNGPLQGIIVWLILVGTGALILAEAAGRRVDRVVGWVERVLIVVATLGMTALVFNSYLIEQTASLRAESGATEVDQSAVNGTEPVEALPPAAAAPEASAPTPPAPTDFTEVALTLAGDAEGVELTGADGTFILPATLPLGSYTVTGQFPGLEPAELATLDLKKKRGPAQLLKCDSFTESCRFKKNKSPTKIQASPPPEANAGISLTLSGDAEGVELTGATGTFTLPAALPLGSYTVTGQFPGLESAELATLELADKRGPAQILKCDSFTESCRFKKDRGAAKAQATPDPPPPPSEPTLASVPVSANGDATQVVLLGATGQYTLPTEVPPGSYVVQATFEGQEPSSVGGASVQADVPLQILCRASSQQCVEDRAWFNVWQADGQVNLALMLMVALGFLGASIATQDGKHLSVDATDRLLSPGPARLVKRLTATVSAGLCYILAYASWTKIIDPGAAGTTFPGAKVWWWMASPINALLPLMPGDKYGPGMQWATRTAWEDTMIAQGAEWPFGLAYPVVRIGDGFPLWLPVLFLLVAFAIMGTRFATLALYPPAGNSVARPGTRRPADVLIAGAFPGAIITLGLAIWLGSAWMIVLASLLLVFMGTPLFIAVGVGTLAGWVLLLGYSPDTIVSDMFEASKKAEIIAIPFFVLAGNIMTHGSIAKRLIAFARAVVGPLPGGLGVSAVVACGVFAAISGSSPATVITIGAIMFPMMVKQGYNEEFSLGLLSTSGSLGIIIPPSVPMIIYAVVVSNPTGGVGILSPTDLFKGGVLPGMFIAGMLMLYTFYVNWPRGEGERGVPLLTAEDRADGLSDNYFKSLGTTFVRGFASLMLPVVVLGGIYNWFSFGGFTIGFDVTSAAAIAVVYALFVELFLHRELKFSDVPRVCTETASMIGSLFLILLIAISLNKLLVLMRVPEIAAEYMLSYTTSPLTFLIVVNLFLLALGCVMDIVSAIIIIAPLLAPIAVQYGIHPIHFGIMFIVNLELGYLTPPLGINLFVASTTFDRPLIKVIKGVLPFLLVMLFCLAVIIWAPRLFEGATGISVPGLPAYIEAPAGP